jgi:hypothetical protein
MLESKGEESLPKVKAAYIFNFAKFVEWPGLKVNQPLTICLHGDSELADAMRGVDGRIAGGHPVVVRTVDNRTDFDGCQIAYSAAMSDETRSYSGTLTLTESPGSGIIQFFLEGSKLRFKVSTRRASSAGVRVSSQLLKLAVVLED